MKKQVLALLLVSTFTQSLFPVIKRGKPARKQTATEMAIGNVLFKMITFPGEPEADTPIEPDENGLIQLDENRIRELHEKIKYNFMRRNQLSYGSLALKAAVFGIGLYQFGFFNLVAPAPKSSDPTIEALKAEVTLLKKLVKVCTDKLGIKAEEIATEVTKQTRIEWLLSSTKSITQFCALGIATAKLMQINNYIEAKPTMAYFFNRHNVVERVEVLRKTVAAAVQPMDDDIHSIDYHRRAVAPMLQSIAINLEKFVAFTEYYFASHDQEVVRTQAMEDQSRRLFNVSNAFLKKMHEQLQKPVFDPDIVAIVEEFKGELTLSIKRCTFFEKEFVQED